MGLHRKTYPSDLSVIEVQTRRRLWWQIVRLDSHCAQKCRVDVLANPEHWQSTLPLNVNDSDLTPDMLVEPRGHVGSTEMTFRLMMYDIGKFIRHSTAMAPFGGSWQKLSSLSIPMSDKDHVIDELEEMIESKYLRYCDPVIPLHILARSIARILVSRMRLTTRHPRRFPDRGASMPEEEKQKIFEICLAMIEQDNLLHSLDCIRGFLWFIESEFQVDAFVYLLSELRRRDSEPITEKAWSDISKAFEHHPNLASDKNPLNVAIRNLTLKSWESWENRAWQKQSSQIPRPALIQQLLEQRKFCATTTYEYSGENATMDVDVGASNPSIPYITSAPANWDFGLTSISDPIVPIDWNYWNDLIQDSENYRVDSLAPQTEWTA
jgi:hypothetical protein